MTERLKRRIKPLCLVLVLALLSALLTGCAGGAAQKIRLSSDGAYTPQSAGDAFHLVSAGSLTKKASTDELSLCFDKDNAGVAVKDSDGELLCAALGAFADSCGLSAVFTMTVCGDDGKLYNLNSQDNCAVYGAYEAKETPSGLTIRYSLALNKENAFAETASLPDDALRVDIMLAFTLDGNALCVSCDCAAMFVSDGYTVLSLAILPGFAADIPTDDGFFLLPDGCGALADISGEASEELSYTYYYGGPDTVSGETGGTAYLPAFAFGNGAMSVCVTAESGEGLFSVVYLRRAQQSGGAIYPSFTLTADEQSGSHLYLGASYAGTVSLRYTFLGADRTYADIATVCRERFVRNALLPAGTLEAEDDIPFLLTAVGALNSHGDTSYTQFSEAKEMLSILKAKGVNNLALRYIGTLSGGLLQKDITDAKLLRSLGGSGDLSELTDYARVQKLKVFFEINLLSSDQSGALRTLSGEKALISPFSEAYSPFLGENSGSYVLPLKKLDSRVEAALSLMSGKNVSLGDVCGSLYSDPQEGYTRQESMNAVKEACRAFAAEGEVMLSGPALYLLRSVDYVDGLPTDTVTAHEDNITAVPFLQIVLHGTVCYAGTPLNFSGDLNYAVLKCVEYGCLPSAVLTYRSVKTDYDTYYTAQSQNLASAYEKMDAELSDLYGERITGHTKIKEGVYCTEYANTTLVYVNYTDKSVEVSGLTLGAMEYMRVN